MFETIEITRSTLIIIGVFVLVIATLIFASAVISTNKKMNEYTDEIIFFGIPISINDYISIIQTFAAYLISSNDNTLDLNDFIDSNLLRYPGMDGNFTLIERSLNQLPIIACKHMGKGKYVIDETELVRKYEVYQKQTQRDEYIIPMFQIDVVTRNPNLFNFSTRFQQNETSKILLRSDMINKLMDNSEAVIAQYDKEMEKNYKKDFKPLAMLLSEESNYGPEEEYYDEYENEYYNEYEDTDTEYVDNTEDDTYYEEESDDIDGQINIFDYASDIGVEMAS